MRAAVLVLLLVGLALEAKGDRIFYRAGTWLETSSEVQRLSLLGILRGWGRIAAEVEDAALGGDPLSHRQQEALRLTECLTAPMPRPVAELQERVTAFAAVNADRIFYSLSDFIAEGLRGLCRSR